MNPFCLDQVIVNPNKLTLQKQGKVVQIRPKVMAVLEKLAQNHGGIVLRDEFVEEIWEGNTFVGPRGLIDAIWDIRKKFSEEFGMTEVIGTVNRKGYELLLEPSAIAEDRKGYFWRNWSWFVYPLVGLLFIGIKTLKSQATIEPEKAWQTHVISTLSGAEMNAKLNPNRNQIAFLKRVANQNDIFLMPFQKNAEVEPLTHSPGTELNMCWSPDGTQLAYIVRENGVRRIEVQDLKSKESRTLPETNHVSEMSNLAWRDQTLLFSGHLADSLDVALIAYNMQNQTQKIVFRKAGHEVMAASWVPHTSKLSFILCDHSSEKRQIAILDGAQLDILFTPGKQPGAFCWDQGGQNIYFTCWDYPLTLYHFSLSDRITRVIKRSEDLLFHFLNSDQAGGILTERGDLRNQIIRLSENGHWETTFSSTGYELSPSYAAQTKQMVFVSNRNGSDQIWMGKDNLAKPLTSVSFPIYKPSVTSDGKKIAFVGKVNLSHHLFILDVASGEIRNLSENLGRNYTGVPNWSSNDQFIYIGYHLEQNFRLSKFSTEAFVSDLDYHALSAFEYADKLVFADTRDNLVYQVDSNGVKKVFDQPIRPTQLARQGSAIYFVVDQSPDYPIFKYHNGSSKHMANISPTFKQNASLIVLPNEEIVIDGFLDLEMDIIQLKPMAPFQSNL